MDPVGLTSENGASVGEGRSAGAGAGVGAAGAGTGDDHVRGMVHGGTLILTAELESLSHE